MSDVRADRRRSDIRGWERVPGCQGCIPDRDTSMTINPGCSVHGHMTTRIRR